MPNTIRWITPRIRYLEFTDSAGNECYDIAYNVWDIRAPKTFLAIREAILDEAYVLFAKMPWFVVPTRERGVEERHFRNFGYPEAEERLSKAITQQVVRNFASIWAWRPSIKKLVVRDMKRFSKEDPKYRAEFERWYRVERQDPYRKPNFFRDFLRTKTPMREDSPR